MLISNAKSSDKYFGSLCGTVKYIKLLLIESYVLYDVMSIETSLSFVHRYDTLKWGQKVQLLQIS